MGLTKRAHQGVRDVRRVGIASAIACVMAGVIGLPARGAAQSVNLPAGRIDSVTLAPVLQMIDFVFVDDRPRAAGLFAEVLARADDLDASQVAQVRHLTANARAEYAAAREAYRELARIRGGEFEAALPRVLLVTGDFTEALARARAWRPAPGAPARPWVEEVETTMARLRGEHATALKAARAMRRYAGYATNPVARQFELGALAQLVPEGASRMPELRAFVDTLLADVPRGFRIDPVNILAGYGDALMMGGHAALAERAWQRALAVLDSTAARAADRGAVGPDSVRIGRGRLLLALGQFAEARRVLEAPSLRRDFREQYRQGWLALAALRMGDRPLASRIDARLAADTAHALRGATAVARATIAEAQGQPARAATLLLAVREAIDLRTMMGQWQLRRTLQDPRVVAWLRGR